MVFETGLPTRYYLSRTDIDFGHLTPVDTITACPCKGVTSGYLPSGLRTASSSRNPRANVPAVRSGPPLTPTKGKRNRGGGSAPPGFRPCQRTRTADLPTHKKEAIMAVLHPSPPFDDLTYYPISRWIRGTHGAPAAGWGES